MRDKLKLRKNPTKKDSAKVHHYASDHNCERYDVLLGAKRIPWKQVWREIRRYGLHKETARKRRETPLLVAKLELTSN